jgi:O-antigen ligase
MGGLEEATRESSWRLATPPLRRHRPRPAPRPAVRDRLLAGGLAAIPAAAIVLFGAVEPEHALPLEAAALLLGGWAVFDRARRGDRPLPLPGVTLPVLLLAALPALQLVPLPASVPALIAPGLLRFGTTSQPTISVFPQGTYLALLRWLAYAAFLIAGLEILRRPGAVRTALGVVAALGVAEAVYGVGNLLLGNQWLLWVPRTVPPGDATGTLVNRNHYAAVFELSLPALLARRWLDGRRSHDEHGLTALYLAAATTMGLSALLSRSRAGIVCLALGLGLAGALVPRESEGRGTRRLLAMVGVLAAAYGMWFGLGTVVGRFAELTDPATALRPRLWRDALDLAADFPLLGVGAGVFGYVFPAYRVRLTDQTGFAHAHQDYLELAIETGLAGLVAALVAAALFVRVVAPGMARSRGAPRTALALLSGGTAAILMHAAVDFPLHIPGLVFLLLLVAAAIVTLATRRA